MSTLAPCPTWHRTRSGHGFNVSVNTDNRLMSGVMPSTELLAVATTFNLTTAEIEQLVVNGVMAGFAPLETRKQIIDQQVRPAFAMA